MRNVIYFKNDQNKIQVDADLKKIIRRAINKTLEYESTECPCEVSVSFVDNDGIRVLNREYRKKDKETDVLSFPIFDDLPSERKILGDIVLSLEKANEQAKEYGVEFEWEVAFLTVHSVLHLLGYDHETGKRDEKIMFSKQDEIMKEVMI